MERNDIGYLEGCATKYIIRHHKKNGKQDVQKAEHYVEKLINLAQDECRCSRNRFEKKEEIEKFIQQNELRRLESIICRYLFKVWTIEDLYLALYFIRDLLNNYEDYNGRK